MVMERALRIGACLAACLIVAGCGGGSSSSGTSSSSGNGIAGSWAGTWLSSSSNTGKIDMNLNAGNNGAVSGNITRHTISACTLSSFSGTFTAGTGKLTGTFKGNGNNTTYTATLSGSSLSGNYRVMSGGCAGDTGTINFSR